MIREAFWEFFSREEMGPEPTRVAHIVYEGLYQTRKFAACKMFIHGTWALGGHEEKSYHYSGLAVDFHFEKGIYTLLEEFVILSSIPEWGALGYYPWWNSPGWHADCRTWLDKRTVWICRGKNDYDSTLLNFAKKIGEKK